MAAAGHIFIPMTGQGANPNTILLDSGYDDDGGQHSAHCSSACLKRKGKSDRMGGAGALAGDGFRVTGRNQRTREGAVALVRAGSSYLLLSYF